MNKRLPNILIRKSAYCAAMIGVLIVTVSIDAHARRPRPEISGVGIKNRLGKQLFLDIPFVDHNGKQVRLADYFNDKRPVLLTLNYYRCTTLCNVQLNQLVKTLKKMTWKPGKKFRMVTISIDPREKPALARQKRRAYLKYYGTDDANFEWHFLTGSQKSIDSIASDVGFQYKWVPKNKMFSHVPVAFFVSPSGMLTRYLQGLTIEPRDIKFSLMDASRGKLGSLLDKALLYCFHFDPNAGKYGPLAFNIMKVGGALSALVLGLFLIIMWRRDLARQTLMEKAL